MYVPFLVWPIFTLTMDYSGFLPFALNFFTLIEAISPTLNPLLTREYYRDDWKENFLALAVDYSVKYELHTRITHRTSALEYRR